MTYILALAQCQAFADYRDNLEKARFFARKAKEANAELLVFPEYFMVPYELSAKEYVKAAQPMDGPFVTAMQELAAANDLWIVFTMNEKLHDLSDKSYNTSVIVDNHGNLVSKYQKVHLFDAYGTRESDRTVAGEHLFTPVLTPFGKIGLGMCYDLRFPELARQAALNGCDLLIYPSAWVNGEGKSAQWHAMLSSRAIENGIFTAGCGHCSDLYLGESQITDPFGNILAQGGRHEEVLTAEIDLHKVRTAAEKNPWKHNRRDWLY